MHGLRIHRNIRITTTKNDTEGVQAQGGEVMGEGEGGGRELVREGQGGKVKLVVERHERDEIGLKTSRFVKSRMRTVSLK